MSTKIYFDGACEPINPGGTASYGWLIKRGDKIVAKGSGIVGSGNGMTNNVAEYTALIEALKHISKSNIVRCLNIFGDSNLVCNHISKKWGWNNKKTKWVPHKDSPHLKNCLDEVFDLLRNYKYEINWIPREQNQEADQLSKEALIKVGIKLNPEKILCSECGGFLIMRKGKFGDFYGCSNYPKCRYTQKLNK